MYLADDLIELKYTATHTPYTPATHWQPEEGGDVEITDIEGTVDIAALIDADDEVWAYLALYLNETGMQKVRAAVGVKDKVKIDLSDVTSNAVSEVEQHECNVWEGDDEDDYYPE